MSIMDWLFSVQNSDDAFGIIGNGDFTFEQVYEYTRKWKKVDGRLRNLHNKEGQMAATWLLKGVLQQWIAYTEYMGYNQLHAWLESSLKSLEKEENKIAQTLSQAEHQYQLASEELENDLNYIEN